MTIKLTGENLTAAGIAAIANQQQPVELSDDSQVTDKIDASHKSIETALAKKKSIYGVNTNFGGLSNQTIDEDDVDFLQQNVIWGLCCGVGEPIPTRAVRAGMTVRMNALMKGVSGTRLQLIERYCHLLNEDFIPVVFEHGSIGASGDLVPLAHVAAAVMGFGDEFEVVLKGEHMGSVTALAKLGMKPAKLHPKEGLALVNGTSMLTGMAALCINDFENLLSYNLHLHAMQILAMEGDLEAFTEFPHQVKPHPGQIKVAALMRELLGDAVLLAHPENSTNHDPARLRQDRYSIRCLPQFLGPIYEGLETAKAQIEIEANSASDNPLIDADHNHFYHAGNFLGQHVSMAMDQLRNFIGLSAKHMDSQISLLVMPQFNRGLPLSLAAPAARVHYGFNGLQICANSIVPRLIHLSHAIAPLFQTHSETFNQNINSQGYASSNLTREAIETWQEYLAVATLFAVQALELRTQQDHEHCLATELLPEPLKPLYLAVYEVLGLTASSERPLVVDNTDQALTVYLKKLTQDLRSTDSKLLAALV